jgi:hypothetical protein
MRESRNRCDDAIPMFHVNADRSAQLLTMDFSLHVETEQMKCCVQELKEVLPDMNPGFRLLTNLTDLEEMEASCAVYVEEIMGLCNGKKISEVVRVIPDPTKDIGFNIMCQFHYSKDVQMRTYENLADAMESLAV